MNNLEPEYWILEAAMVETEIGRDTGRESGRQTDRDKDKECSKRGPVSELFEISLPYISASVSGRKFGTLNPRMYLAV